MKAKIADIQIKDRIRKDMGDMPGLIEDIKKNGLIVPISISPENLLIAGERRIKAAIALGWTEIEANMIAVTDYLHQLNCEISENKCREGFTPLELVECGLMLEQAEKLLAKERQIEVLKKGNDLPSGSTDSNGTKGKTDDIVGKKIGMSGPSYRRAKRVIESGNKEVIEKMDKGEISVIAAYNIVKGKEETKPAESEPSKLEIKEEKEEVKTPSKPRARRGEVKAMMEKIHAIHQASLVGPGAPIKKEASEKETHKNSLLMNINYFQSVVNQFMTAVTVNYPYTSENVVLLPEEERIAISAEIERLENWCRETKNILKI